MRNWLIHHSGWFHWALKSLSVASIMDFCSRKNRLKHPLMKLACAFTPGIRFAASTAWLTRVKMSYGHSSLFHANARTEHKSASAIAGGRRCANKVRKDSARPRLRKTWNIRAWTPSRRRGGTCSSAIRVAAPPRTSTSARATACNCNESGGAT